MSNHAQPATLLDSSVQWNIDLDVNDLTEEHRCTAKTQFVHIKGPAVKFAKILSFPDDESEEISAGVSQVFFFNVQTAFI